MENIHSSPKPLIVLSEGSTRRPRGGQRKYFTEEERLAARQQQVRKAVKAHGINKKSQISSACKWAKSSRKNICEVQAKLLSFAAAKRALHPEIADVLEQYVQELDLSTQDLQHLLDLEVFRR